MGRHKVVSQAAFKRSGIQVNPHSFGAGEERLSKHMIWTCTHCDDKMSYHTKNVAQLRDRSAMIGKECEYRSRGLTNGMHKTEVRRAEALFQIKEWR